MVIKGKCAEAIVFTDEIEESAIAQLKTLCDQEFVKDSSVRIMPDVHSGTGCVIGFTANLGKKVIPSLVGVDIGCGMYTVVLGKRHIDFKKLDSVIHEYVPAGMSVHSQIIRKFPQLTQLHCYGKLRNIDHLKKSMGTLGGGNHFIEVDVDEEGTYYLIIHSGSRNLGKQVAEYYQDIAIDNHYGRTANKKAIQMIVDTLKAEGRQSEIQERIAEYKKAFATIPKDLCYLEGEDRENYLHDMRICQEFAYNNREEIANIICEHLKINPQHCTKFHTIHNYISDDDMIRKGAISAQADELLLIPINMRDGCIFGKGKGNPEWNFSAPHGAGRLMSRKQARQTINLSDFQEAMKGIYSTSVNESTLDESPMAYKNIDSILSKIVDTVEVKKIIKPVYNFKASD